MRTMGLNESADLASWIVITFIELAIVFFLAVMNLYIGGIMQFASQLLIYVFLLIFGLGIISFWCEFCFSIIVQVLTLSFTASWLQLSSQLLASVLSQL